MQEVLTGTCSGCSSTCDSYAVCDTQAAEAWKEVDMMDHEPTDLEWAVVEREQMGLPPIGPLTLKQQQGVEAYERYCEEMAEEYEASQAAGGRTICPQCGERSVTHRTVVTYGYEGHPGADYSDLASCEKCDYMEV